MASGSGTAQVSFTTTARATSVPVGGSGWETSLPPEWLPLLLVTVSLLFLLGHHKTFRRLRMVAIPALLMVIGCGSTGSRSNTIQTGVGTPAGTYNLTITGTAGSQTHTTNLTVVIN